MAKKPKLPQDGSFRIKDYETGLYWSRNIVTSYEVQPDGTNKRCYSHWSKVGTVYHKRGPAESVVTSLTRTFKSNRDTEAKIILYGNKETARYSVVECDIVDKS